MILDWTGPTTVEHILEKFGDYDPKFVNFIKLAKDPKIWQLRSLGPLTSWIRGRTCLVGDAAHSMMPSKQIL